MARRHRPSALVLPIAFAMAAFVAGPSGAAPLPDPACKIRFEMLETAVAILDQALQEDPRLQVFVEQARAAEGGEAKAGRRETCEGSPRTSLFDFTPLVGRAPDESVGLALEARFSLGSDKRSALYERLIDYSKEHSDEEGAESLGAQLAGALAAQLQRPIEEQVKAGTVKPAELAGLVAARSGGKARLAVAAEERRPDAAGPNCPIFLFQTAEHLAPGAQTVRAFHLDSALALGLLLYLGMPAAHALVEDDLAVTIRDPVRGLHWKQLEEYRLAVKRLLVGESNVDRNYWTSWIFDAASGAAAAPKGEPRALKEYEDLFGRLLPGSDFLGALFVIEAHPLRERMAQVVSVCNRSSGYLSMLRGE